MDYKKRLTIKCACSALLAVLGAGALVLGFLKYTQSDGSFGLLGYYCGTGGALVGAGVTMFIRTRSLLQSDAKLQNAQIEAQDERNLLIAYRSGYFTFVIFMLLMYAASLYLLFVGSALFAPLMQLCAAMCCLYVLLYFILRKVN